MYQFISSHSAVVMGKQVSKSSMPIQHSFSPCPPCPKCSSTVRKCSSIVRKLGECDCEWWRIHFHEYYKQCKDTCGIPNCTQILELTPNKIPIHCYHIFCDNMAEYNSLYCRDHKCSAHNCPSDPFLNYDTCHQHTSLQYRTQNISAKLPISTTYYTNVRY